LQRTQVAIESLLPTNPEEYIPKKEEEGSEEGADAAPAEQ
jgi:membrane protein required for colicin V production